MVEHIRKSSEAIILILIVLSPWAFGCVHPFFRYLLTSGVCAVLLLWAAELLVAPNPKLITRFQLPLLGLIGIVGLQVLPLGPVVETLSPGTAKWRQAMYPESIEQLADDSPAAIPDMTARTRVSVYPAETMRRGYWLVLMALLFTRVQDLANPRTLRRLCYVCLINGSILAYFSVIQHFTSETGKIFWTFQSMGAAFGPFINRNHFAFYTNICFGLALGLVGSRQMATKSSATLESLVESLNDLVSLWMISVLVFMLGAVILCSSRSGLISLIGSSLITAVFIAATGTFRDGWKWFALAGAIFAVAATVQMWLGFDFVESRYASTLDNRTQLWLPLLNLIPQFPVIGSGLGTLPFVEPTTRPLIEARDYYLEYAHNEYLQLAIETGILGLLCGCLLIGLLASKIARRIRKSRHNAWLYVGLLFSLTSVALHSFTEFGVAIPAIAFLTAVVFGHIAGVGRAPKKATESNGAVGIATNVGSRVLAVAMIVFVIVAFQDAKMFDLGERSLLAAQRAHNEGRTEDELAHYQTALYFTPNDVEMLLEVVRIQFEVESDETVANREALLSAQQTLVRTRELCPLSGDAQFLLGRHVDTFAQADSALAYYSRALQTRPTDPTLAYIAGLAHLKNDDREAAIPLFNRSLSLAPQHLFEILDHFRAELVPADPADAQPVAIDRSTNANTDAVESATTLLTGLLPAEKSTVLLQAADWLDRQAGRKLKDGRPEKTQPSETPSEPAGTQDPDYGTPIDEWDNLTEQLDDDNPVKPAQDLFAEVSDGLRRRALQTQELKRPTSGKLASTKAVLHMRLDEPKEAIRAWERALLLEPNRKDWRLLVARMLGDQKDYDRAHRHLKKIRGDSRADRLGRQLFLEAGP